MRILIVEDEESLALRMKNILESDAYHVETAFDGQEGLEAALTEEYDLLILDILLPNLNGLEILKEIRTQGLKIPVLLLTVKDGTNDKVEGLDAGVGRLLGAMQHQDRHGDAG